MAQTYNEFEGEHRSPGYYMDEQERADAGMDADGEWTSGQSFRDYLDRLREKSLEIGL